MKSLSCPNGQCSLSGKAAVGHVIRYGFYKTRWGKRRRYLCRVCGKTFCLTTSTPYHRLQHCRATFDEVASLSVEGLNKSAIARVKGIAWNTAHRWLERAAVWCRRFNNRKIKNLSGAELQADEIRTIVGSKRQSIWVFAVIDVWSRLWPSTMVGKRSYQNTLALFRDLSRRYCQLGVVGVRLGQFMAGVRIHQAHVTSSQTRKERDRKRRWLTDRSRWRPIRKRFWITPCTDQNRCA
jgi:transposase-like protein